MSYKVLLADDEERALALARATLECIGGVELLEARDGEEALNIARHEKPDVIILDVLMPKKNGYEVCLDLKRDLVTRQAKVVMLTGLDRDFDRRKALHEVGADAYFPKPFSPTALLEKVDKLLASR